MAQLVRNPPAMRESWVWSLGQEDPLEKGIATHSSILAWRNPWTEDPGRLRVAESNTTEWIPLLLLGSHSSLFFFFFLGKIRSAVLNLGWALKSLRGFWNPCAHTHLQACQLPELGCGLWDSQKLQVTCSRVETRALDFNMRFSAIIPGLRSLSACHAGSEQIDVGCLEQGVHLFLMSLEAVLLHGSKWTFFSTLSLKPRFCF